MKSLSWLLRSPSVAAVLFCAGIFCFVQSGGDAQVWHWSQTSNTNASIDPSINWAEGQSPSSVNDSARAMMAGLAKWRDDLNGTVTTGGGPNAYTVTSNQGLTAFTPGHRICFNANIANSAIDTINVDGLGNKPLRSAPGVELSAGMLTPGTPYCATYFASNSGEYILGGAVNAGVPLCGATGYKLVNNNSLPNTELDYSADTVTMVSSAGLAITRSGVSGTINTANLNVANGLDPDGAGALAASTNYFVWLIDNGTGAAGLLSTSATAPVMPTGCTFKCRVSATSTTGTTQLIPIETMGAETFITAAVVSFVDNSLHGTCGSLAANVTFNALPPTAIETMGFLFASASGSSIELVRNANAGAVIAGVISNPAGQNITIPFHVQMTTPQQLSFCNSNTNNLLSIYGWVDKVNAH